MARIDLERGVPMMATRQIRRPYRVAFRLADSVSYATRPRWNRIAAKAAAADLRSAAGLLRPWIERWNPTRERWEKAGTQR